MAAQNGATDIPGSRFLGTGVPVTLKDIGDGAASIRIETACLLALIEVEARGRGFGRFGRVKALYEPHHFSAYTGGKYDETHPHLSSPYWNRSLYGVPPHGVFEQIDEASRLDLNAAIKATSWGFGQLMGMHHKKLGFVHPIDMVDDARKGEPNQLRQMIDLIRAEGADTHLRSHDFDAFSRIWNGPGYKKNGHARKMRAAYRKHSQTHPYAVLRYGDAGPAVAELQRLLTAAGYETSMDAVYGEKTQSAVRAFQAAHGLKVDGVAGAMTLRELKASPQGRSGRRPTVNEATPSWAKPLAVLAGIVEPIARIFDTTILGLFPGWALGVALIGGVGVVAFLVVRRRL